MMNDFGLLVNEISFITRMKAILYIQDNSTTSCQLSQQLDDHERDSLEH